MAPIDPAAGRAIRRRRAAAVTCLAAWLAASLAAAATAESPPGDCAALGVQNPYLAQHFCQRLHDLAGQDRATAPTRGLEDTDDDTEALLEELQILNDAYQADPKKTLDLISRIREAGGLVQQ